MKRDWRDALLEWERAGVPHVLVTVVQAVGSTPREAGAKMAVSVDDQRGSIGGGNLEFEAAAKARALIAEGASEPVLDKILLGPDLGQCCGGGTTLLFEPFIGTGRILALFGAGHVGAALVRVLEGSAVRVLWIDDRAETLPSSPSAEVTPIVAPDLAEAVADLPAGCHALVMTHSHDMDYAVLEALLRRGGFASIGLIGSDSKWARFRRRLLEGGLSSEVVSSVICPIGVPGINGKRPAEIAIAAAARLLQDAE